MVLNWVTGRDSHCFEPIVDFIHSKYFFQGDEGKATWCQLKFCEKTFLDTAPKLYFWKGEDPVSVRFQAIKE